MGRPKDPKRKARPLIVRSSTHRQVERLAKQQGRLIQTVADELVQEALAAREEWKRADG